VTWNSELQRIVLREWKIGQVFTLNDIYKFDSYFAKLYPWNRHRLDKLRQTLQNLRDLGIIEFVDEGRYRRLR